MSAKAPPGRIIYFGTFNPDAPRQRLQFEGLHAAGIDVRWCNEPLWRGTDDRVAAASGAWQRPAFWWRAARAYWQIVIRFFFLPRADIILVGYPGPVDVLLARLLARRGERVVWDVLMAVHLIAIERGLDRTSPFSIHALREVERLAARTADLLLIDTPEYAEWLVENLKVPRAKIREVPLACDWPAAPAPASRRELVVMYHGGFIPNHGVGFALAAAEMLSNVPGVRFEFIGRGPDRAALEERYGSLPNVRFWPWQEGGDLQAHVAQADVCLGAFGTTTQSLVTVHNKVLEALAAGRAVLTGDSPPMRRVFEHGTNVWLCPRADAAAIADALRALHADREMVARLGENGRQVAAQCFSPTAASRHLLDALTQ